MQFQVPQFIETEDRIVGPFTIRQFIYMAIAGGFCFILYFTVQPWLFILLSILFLGTAAAFGFVKISGRPLVRVAVSALGFYWKPHTYVWQAENPEVPKSESALQSEASSNVSLENIVSGMALRNAWQSLQTGEKTKIVSNAQFYGKVQEQYQLYRKLSGEREAARRIDYR